MVRNLQELLRQGVAKHLVHWASVPQGGGKGDPPDPPDYAAAATAQGEANKEAAIASSLLNNPNVINPYGTQTWTEGTSGGGIDEVAYKAALDAWNQSGGASTFTPSWSTFIGGDQAGTTQSAGQMPNREDFRVTTELGRPTMTQTLSPEQQALYNQSLQTRELLGGLGIQGATALQDVVGRNLDLSGAPEAGNTDFTSGAPALRDTNFAANLPELRSTDFTLGASAIPGSYEDVRKRVIDASMSRANEDYAKQGDQANSSLIAAGIRPGTKAYGDSMQMIERSRNDARTQAEIAGGNAAQQAFGVDAARRAATIGENQGMFGASLSARQQALDSAQKMFGASQAARQQTVSENAAEQGAQDRQRQQAIAEILAQRQTPLNEINALMSGSQVSNPFAMPGVAQNSNVQAAPMFGAAQAQYGANMDAYNAQQASGGNMMSGLFSLGGAALGAPVGTFSDRRLKTNIKRIGTHVLGIGLYAWDYLWGEHAEGVMADEVLTVMPDAVLQHPSGFMMVDYSMIGGGYAN